METLAAKVLRSWILHFTFKYSYKRELISPGNLIWITFLPMEFHPLLLFLRARIDHFPVE